MDLPNVSYDLEDCLSQVFGQNIHSKVQRKKKKRVNYKKTKTKEEGEEKKERDYKAYMFPIQIHISLKLL